MVDSSSINFDRFWDSSPYEMVVVNAVGRSGGLFCMWNLCLLKVDEIIKDPNFIVVSGQWGVEMTKVFLANIYAPVDNDCRRSLWFRLLDLKSNRNNGAWLLTGDFNEVTRLTDRFSEHVCIKSMDDFNHFIRDAGLTEFNLGGRRFTWMSSDGKSLSKLDRFLACVNFIGRWTNSSVVALQRRLSDHCPILLSTNFDDYGPSPFRFFSSWLSIPAFNSLVIDNWVEGNSSDPPDVRLLKKFRCLKSVIRNWRADSLKKKMMNTIGL